MTTPDEEMRETVAIGAADQRERDEVFREVVELLATARFELAALVPKPVAPRVQDWPCENPGDRWCLQKAYYAIDAALTRARPYASREGE